VIHTFSARGLAALDPRWAGGRPRLVSDGDLEVIVAAAGTRPGKLAELQGLGKLAELEVDLRRILQRAPIQVLQALLFRKVPLAHAVIFEQRPAVEPAGSCEAVRPRRRSSLNGPARRLVLAGGISISASAR
jgi:hypothetical protein